MNSASQQVPNRLSEFDVLRSLAILGVIIIHAMTALEVSPESGSWTYFLVVFIYFCCIILPTRYRQPVLGVS